MKGAKGKPPPFNADRDEDGDFEMGKGDRDDISPYGNKGKGK